MILSRRRASAICTLFAVVNALLAAGAASSLGQDQTNDENTVTLKPLGMEIFRFALFKQKIEPLSNVNELLGNPANTIIILMGEESLNWIHFDNIRVAVRQGASLLIASDRSNPGGTLREAFGVTLTNERVEADPDDCYRNEILKPYVQPFRNLADLDQAAPETDKSSPRFPFQSLAGAGENALATNIATVLRISPNNPWKLQPLAGYPFSARSALRNGRLHPQRDLFAAGGTMGKGRVMILADHSIFENFMVWREDNANRYFMQDCIDWLQGPEKKTKCLFVEDGNVRTDFELKVPEKPMDWWKYLAYGRHVINKAGNQLIEESQEKDIFNRLFVGKFGQRAIIRFVLIAVSALVLLAGFLMLIRGRVRPDPARTLVTPELAALIPRHGVLKQRFEGQIDSNNVYESARQLVREFMTGMDAEPGADGRPPQIVIEDGYRNPAALRRRIMRLWTIGFSPTPVKVLPQHWTRLTEDLRGILEDADEGWWRFVSDFGAGKGTIAE